tara:strand:- start:1343 stop:2311 length:969 start_codon:yes stop_codon:yes gene_type:complete
MKFIDQATLYLKAGDGGHGCIAFKREMHRPKGGPCGGDGGNGGSIIFKVDRQLTTLQDVSYRRHYKADRGMHGQGSDRHGKNGKNLILHVPPGTIISNIDTEQIIGELLNHNDQVIVCKGGNGGFGNARFKTHSNSAPDFANDGELGEEIKVLLELKILADVGLVGFPNAGKSTFISKISSAKPKVGDYPFTTLIPNLGIVKYSEYKSFVMADIPGLISGASDGKGLGSQFLKHIERTKILVFMIDSSSDDINEEYKILKNELKKHNEELSDRKSFLLLTKSDVLNDDIKNIPQNVDYIIISSITNSNLKIAIQKIAQLLER